MYGVRGIILRLRFWCPVSTMWSRSNLNLDSCRSGGWGNWKTSIFGRHHQWMTLYFESFSYNLEPICLSLIHLSEMKFILKLVETMEVVVLKWAKTERKILLSSPFLRQKIIVSTSILLLESFTIEIKELQESIWQ